MQTIEIEKPSRLALQYLEILRSSSKRPGAINALPEVTYVNPSVMLDAVQIARYRQVCGINHAQGLPLLYPQLLTFPLAMEFFTSEHCPWPAMGTVHLANRIRQHQRLNAGDSVRVELATGNLFTHEKGQIFNLEMTILRDGERVWEATQTLLRLGVKNPVGPTFTSSLTTDLPLSHQADFSAPADIGRRYARVSGDFNPIHMSLLSAKLFGFHQPIAHGLWTAARALSAVAPAKPMEEAELLVEFKTPLFLPACVSLWSSHVVTGPGAHSTQFEVRNATGDKPHLVAQLRY